MKDNDGVLPLDFALDSDEPKRDVVDLLKDGMATVTADAQVTPVIEEVVEKLEETVKHAPPEIKKGKLKKEGHMIKNWKERFFVLDLGVLSYYSKEQEAYPFGADLKGTVNLGEYELVHHAEQEKILLQDSGI